jgi:hypothetical protein
LGSGTGVAVADVRARRGACPAEATGASMQTPPSPTRAIVAIANGRNRADATSVRSVMTTRCARLLGPGGSIDPTPQFIWQVPL